MKKDLGQVYFVTGAAGFVGSMLVRRLVAENKQVHVLLKSTTDIWRLAEIAESLTIHYGDLQSSLRLQKLLKRIQPDVIYHLATRGAYAQQNQANDCFETNVQGTWNLLRASQEIPYSLFVNTGSSSEYGYSTKPMSESDALVPNSWYAATKAAAGLLALQWAEQFQKPIVHLRLFSVFGPYEEKGRLFPTLMANAYFNKPLQLVSPDIARDYIYIDDVIDLYRAEMTLVAQSGQVINVGSGRQIRLQAVVETLEDVVGHRLQTAWGAMPPRPWDSTNWQADMSRSLDVLNWQPTTSLFDGITKMWKWFPAAADIYKD